MQQQEQDWKMYETFGAPRNASKDATQLMLSLENHFSVMKSSHMIGNFRGKRVNFNNVYLIKGRKWKIDNDAHLTERAGMRAK